jgi:inosose dehydratase
LDFSVVDLCVDVAWVYRGDDDQATLLATHKDIIGYLHFKDFDGTDWAELGRGKVDFPSIMKVLPTMPWVRWEVVEQDNSKIDPRDAMTISRKYLKDTFNY